MKNAALYLLYYYLAKAIVRVVFTPRNSKWRIIEVCDEKAVGVSRALIFPRRPSVRFRFFKVWQRK